MSAPVLVVGAGPTGLVLACELLRHGLPVRLIDKLPAPSDKSRALAIHARSLEVFQRMGVAARFLAEGRKTLRISLYVDGKKRGGLDVDDIGADDTPFPIVLMLAQDRTEALLSECLAQRGGRIERGVELVGLSQDAGGVVANLKSGESLTTERYAYVVGCDGAHSAVRHALAIPFAGEAYTEEFLLCDAKLEGGPFDAEALSIFLTNGGLLAQFPLKGPELTRLIMTRARKQRTDTGQGFGTDAVTLDECQAAARELSVSDVRITHPRWLANFRLHHRGVPRYREGRAFLSGDAAHIHSPAGGQGMNTGIQDAFNLAWKLALVAQNRAPVSLLATYDEERRPVGRALLKSTDRFFALMATPKPMLLAVRNLLAPALVGVLARGPRALRRRMFRFISQLAIRYDENAWIGRGGGQRAPDARLRDGTSLFSRLTGVRHHLLCFGVAPPADLPPGIFTPVELAGDEAEAFERYRVHSPGLLVLIRPDGHIALRTEAAIEVLKYAGRFH